MSEVGNDVIKKELIFLQQESQTRAAVLQTFVEKAVKEELITNQIDFLRAILKREGEVPTAIGYQIAMPHGKSSTVKEPFIGFMQTRKEFLWTEGQEETVRLVFLIGVPAENSNNLHLKFISQLSKKLLNAEFRARLSNATKVEQAYNLLRSIKM